MPRLNPDRQIAHALQAIKVATRILKEAEASIRSAVKSPRLEKGRRGALKPSASPIELGRKDDH